MEKRTKPLFVALFVVMCLAMFAVGFLVGQLIWGGSAADEPAAETQVQEPVWSPNVETEAEPTAEPSPSPSPSPEPTEEPAETAVPVGETDLSGLQETLDASLAGFGSDWVVLVQELKSGETVVSTSNSELTESSGMVAASVIKLFIAACAYDRIESGDLNENQAKIEIEPMIKASDNTATNALVAMIGAGDSTAGMNIINEYITAAGFSEETRLNRLMGVSNGTQNYVSAADVAELLRRVYAGELVSEQRSEELLGYMLAQERRTKIPAGLAGFDCTVANKTGELWDPIIVENDVAIVRSAGADYVLCVLAENINSDSSAIATINEISREVYLYFNDAE